MGSFVRRVKTASGATAVQIVHKRGRQVVGIDHIGSAHDQDRLALLVETATQRLHADQHLLELDVAPPQPADPGSPVVDATGSLILWVALCGLYDALGFAVVDDEAFRALVLGRIVQPTSKLDTVRVLGEIGVGSPSRVTFMRRLKRVLAKDYRSVIAEACYRRATRAGGLALVLHDVTTHYFETPREDGLRKVGMSKERPADHPRAADRRGRVPAGRAPVRGQQRRDQGRDQDVDPGPDRVRRRAPRHRGCCGGRRRRDAVGGEPARSGTGRVPVHRRIQDQQGAVRPDGACRAARQRVR